MPMPPPEPAIGGSLLRASALAISLAVSVVCTMVSAPAQAGPPYVTDDPEPTDPGHWEIYNFASGTIEDGATAAQAGVDLNYGGARNLQLTATLPLQFGTGQPLSAGDVELAAKYRFLHQHAGGLPLDVAFFPRLILPTGRGASTTQLLLPVWVEHDWGRWSLFGGGVYTLDLAGSLPGNLARNAHRNYGLNRNYWSQGAVLTRLIAPGFSLGLEYYGQGPATIGARAVQGLNLGTQIHLRGPFSLLGAFGQGLNRRQTIFYTSLKLDL